MTAGGNTNMDSIEVAEKLGSFINRFPRGLSLGQEDLAVIGSLYFFQQEEWSRSISDSRLRQLIQETARQLGLDVRSLQPSQLIQRLMRLHILRATLADGSGRGYRLTCFGQDLARHFMDEADYSSEQLNVLLGCALTEIQNARYEQPIDFFKYLKHVFLGTIQEKIEYKLLTIEDDLQERKKEVKRTYSGTSQTDFEDAITDIEHCRAALSELVDTVGESSACVAMEEMLHRCIERQPDHHSYDVIDQSLDFLYLLRGRIDSMLKEVVEFIRDCAAYGSLALTVDARDRLCRTQERILTYALEHDLRMAIVGPLRLPRMDLKWSRVERNRPFILDTSKLKMIEGYCPPDVPLTEPGWKDSFLRQARSEWEELAGGGEVDVSQWLERLAADIPDLSESLWIALWFLSQDWPRWVPRVSVVTETGRWVALGDEWMMESIRLVPVHPVETEIQRP
jgi:hypothetical protein